MSEMTKRDLEFSTLTIIGAGAGMLILGFATLMTMRAIGIEYIDRVGGITRHTSVQTSGASIDGHPVTVIVTQATKDDPHLLVQHTRETLAVLAKE